MERSPVVFLLGPVLASLFAAPSNRGFGETAEAATLKGRDAAMVCSSGCSHPQS